MTFTKKKKKRGTTLSLINSWWVSAPTSRARCTKCKKKILLGSPKLCVPIWDRFTRTLQPKSYCYDCAMPLMENTEKALVKMKEELSRILLVGQIYLGKGWAKHYKVHSKLNY